MQGWTSQRTATELEPSPPRTEPPSHGTRAPKMRLGQKASSSNPWRKLILWVVALGLAIAVISYFAVRRGPGGNQPPGETPRTARVERRDFVHSVRVSGTVEAVQSHPIAAPRLAGQNSGTITITKLLTTGTKVKTGDLLVEFDRQTQIRTAQDREADYNDFVQQINKMLANQAAGKAADDTGIKQAEDAVSNAELEVKRSEVMSRIDAERKRQDLDEANAKLKQLRETYLLKRQADAAAVHVLEIQRDSARNAMNHARENSDKMAIKSPMDGLVVVNSTFKGQGIMADWQAGDDVRAGSPFMQVVNPNAMRVRAPVNQQDIPNLKEGQSAEVRLDAYPDVVFHGKVEQISAIGVGGTFSQKVHNFTVLISIEGADPKLLPDLSAAVDIELVRRPNALVIPRDALLTEGGRTFVQVVSDNSTSKREVKVSSVNEVEAMLESGLDAGQTVLRGGVQEMVKVAAVVPPTSKK
jgi:HlyD family secretion protein